MSDTGVQEVSGNAKDPKEALKGHGRELRHKAAEAMHEFADAAREKGRDALDRLDHSRVGDWGHTASKYTREHPGRSVAIAAAAGFVLGLLVSAGSHRRH